MLSRNVQWTAVGLRLAADPRLVNDIVKELGLAQARPADTPDARESAQQSGLRLAQSQCTKCNVASEIGGASEPLGDGSPRHSLRSVDPWESRLVFERSRHGQAQKSGRFLLGRPTPWTHQRWEEQSDHLVAYTDSDWAADREDTINGWRNAPPQWRLVKFWSSRQRATSLSSWESELHAAVTTGVEAIGLQTGLRDMRSDVTVTIACDNQGAHSPTRLAKHAHTGLLRFQTVRDEGGIRIVKIGTDLNPAAHATAAVQTHPAALQACGSRV